MHPNLTRALCHLSIVSGWANTDGSRWQSFSQVTKEEYAKVGSVKLGKQLERQLRSEGRNPVVIPVGGSNSLGTWGYIEAMREISHQAEQSFTDVVMVRFPL